MTCGLVHASYNLPEWQAVKLTFFTPCNIAKKKNWKEKKKKRRKKKTAANINPAYPSIVSQAAIFI